MPRSSLFHCATGVLTVTAFLSSIFLFLLIDGSFMNPSSALAGRQTAPDFNVSSLDGEHFSNFKLEGERALLMFWAPWCGVCRRELPKLSKYYTQDMPNDLQILTIASSASRGEVEQYVNEHPRTFVFPTAYDANKSIGKDFNIRAFPTYVLLDEDGSIIHIHRGSGILHDRKFQEWAQ